MKTAIKTNAQRNGNAGDESWTTAPRGIGRWCLVPAVLAAVLFAGCATKPPQSQPSRNLDDFMSQPRPGDTF